MARDLKINLERLKSRLDQINSIGALPGGGVKRLSLSNEDREVRDLLKRWFNNLELELEVDQLGNMTGFWGNKDEPIIAIGSHLDTVGTGGCFDGSLGVVAGLEVVETLKESGLSPDKTLALINFTNEEGVRFTPDMMGSYAYAGLGKVEDLWNAKAEESNASLKDELKRIGYLGSGECGKVNPECYFELHIEQGPVLENEGYHLAAVDRVQGIHWTEYIFKGSSNHAGTTPMHLRKDAGHAVARLNVFVRELANETGGVATVGITETFPNLINVVPEHVRSTVDLRNTDAHKLIEAQTKLDAFVTQVAQEESVEVEIRELVRFKPVDFDTNMG